MTEKESVENGHTVQCFLQITNVKAWLISAKLNKRDLKKPTQQLFQQNSNIIIKMTAEAKAGARTLINKAWSGEINWLIDELMYKKNIDN